MNFGNVNINNSNFDDLDIGGSEINGTILLGGGEIEEMEVTLKIGDLISLHVPRLDGYVSAEGILDADVKLTCPPERFDNCVFQLCLRNRVSAAEELAEYEERQANGEEVEESFMDTLRRVKENEKRLNDNMMRDKSGTEVKYADVIQLRHLPSGKFLTVAPNEVARTERENLRVFLDADGSTFSWFTLEAGRAMTPGACVDNNSEIVLAATARENEYLHFSQVQIDQDGMLKEANAVPNGDEEFMTYTQHEINCSLEKNAFKMKLFTEHSPVANTMHGPLHAGELVYLQDPDSMSYLRLLEDCEKQGLDHNEGEGVYFDKPAAGSSVHSGALWLVERVQAATGGPAEFGDLLTFRNLNTGKFLLMRSDQQVQAFDENLLDVNESAFSRPGTGDHNNSGSGASTPLGRLNAMNMPKSPCLCSPLREAECAMTFEPFSRVGLEDSFVKNGSMILLHSETEQVWLCKGGRHPKLHLSRAELSQGEEDRDEAVCLVVKRVDDTTARDVRTPLSALPVLHKYAEAVGRKDVPKLCKDFTKVEHLVNCMIGFCLEGGPEVAEGEESKVTQPEHQTVLKQQGVVDCLLDILERETPLIKHAASMTHSDLKILEKLCRKCFQALHIIILKHPLNQLYVADRFTVIIAYLGKGSVAMRTITEMLGTNMEIQEDKVGQTEVETFISMLRESRMNFTILKLLSALCSCQGVGIDSNQTLLATLLLDQADELLVGVSEKGGKLFVSPPGGQHGPKVGGRPQSASASGNGSQGGGNQIKGEVIALTALSQKRHRELLKFFVAQLYMYAEMCFDRNYIAMQLLQEQVPYSWIITAINEPEITEELRAAFTRLAHTMYIDCKPQERFNAKNLTFCWSTLSKEDCKLPAISHEPENGVSGFSAMQQVVTDHLKQLTEGGQWSLFTYQAVASLEALIQFKFYSSQGELMSVVEPLINGLDFTGTHDLTVEQAAALAAAQANGHKETDSPSKKKADKKANESFSDLDSPKKKKPSLGREDGQQEKMYAALPDKYRSSKVLPDGEEEESDSTLLISVKKNLDLERRIVRSPMQLYVLSILESIPVMVFILVLVFVAIGVDLATSDSFKNTWTYLIWNWFVYFSFLIELLLRVWAINDTRTFWNVKTNGLAVMDAVVVALDTLLIFAEQALASLGSFDPKMLRSVRLMRLVRILKGVRLIFGIKKALQEEKTDVKWDIPERYMRTPDGKLLTMIQMVKTLINVSNMCQSYRLKVLLSQVKTWHLDNAKPVVVNRRSSFSNDGKGEDDNDDETAATQIVTYFEETVANGKALGLDSAVASPDKVNDILLDLCLYEQNELVHNSLTLLMLHHSPLRALQRDARRSQLMVRSEEERLYKTLEDKLSQLQRHAESEEIWGGLETAEHVKISDKVKEILRDLQSTMRAPSPKLLTRRGMYVANKDVQTVIKNLGGFEVAMTVMQLTANLDDDDDAAEDEAVADDMAENAEMENTREILRLCNAFLCWFVHDNPANQELAFTEFDTFRAELPSGLGSAQVISELLRDNERLIKSVDSDFVDGAIELILTKGREPQHLALLDVITHIDEIGIRHNQISVVQQLTEPSQADKLLYLPGAPGTPMYEERRQLMQRSADGTYSSPTNSRSNSPTRTSGTTTEVVAMGGGGYASALSAAVASGGGGGTGDVLGVDLGLDPNAHLPSPLRYHTKLLMTLAGCAAGMINIVEAKVQSLCSFQNVLFALLDPETLTEVRTALARFFYDVIVDVQILVPMLCENEQVWAYMSTFPEVLERACLAVVSLEQAAGYTKTAGRSDMHALPTKPEVLTARKFRNERALLTYCMDALAPICHFFFMNYYNADRVPWHQDKTDCLIGELYTQLLSLHSLESPLFMDEDKDMLLTAVQTVYSKTSVEERKNLVRPPTADEGGDAPAMRRKMSISDRMSALQDDASEKRGSMVEHDKIKDAFSGYMLALDDHEGLQEALDIERSKLIEYLKTVPRLGQEGKFVEFRFEPLLAKLVTHIRSNIQLVGDKKVLMNDHSETALWVISLFRGMIEHEWGFTIDDRDDDGDEESDEKVEATQVALDECGATALCLDLISEGIAPELVSESVRLLIALLYQEGGNAEVQQTINEHLVKSGSQYFFAKVQAELREITAWQLNEWQNNLDDILTEDEEDDPKSHDSLILVQFMQLCCEGHYMPNQDIFREQPGNPLSYNLMTTLVDHTTAVTRMPCRFSTNSLLAVTDAILEVIQGPCVGNQNHFALHTELLETLNRMIRHKPLRDQIEDEEEELKVTCICIFKALVEAQPSTHSMIYDRILSVVHVEVLEQLILGTWGKDEEEMEAGGDGEMSDLQIQALVLMQMLKAYHPDLADDMANTEEIEGMLGGNVEGIEVVWDGVLQKRYFAVPEMCQVLSDPAKDDIVQNVQRNQGLDLQLDDFVTRVQMMGMDLHHESTLKKLGLGLIFSRSTQNTATWVALYLALFVNWISVYSLRYQNAVDGNNSEQPESKGWPYILDQNGEELMQPEPGRYDSPAELAAFGTACHAIEVDESNSLYSYKFYHHAEGEDAEAYKCERLSFMDNWGDLPFSTMQMQNVLNYVQITVSAFTMILFFIVRVPVIYRQRVEIQGSKWYWAMYYAISDFDTMYYTFYVVLCVLALQLSPIWSAFLLLDVVKKKPKIMIVLQAVLKPLEQLLLAGLLCVFVLVIYAFFTFLLYHSDMPNNECNTLLRCFQVTVDFGLRSSGGVGDYMSMDREALGIRNILDLSYFILVLIVLLNIFFGIIIDTFGELRQEKNEQTDKTVNYCFVCGISKLDLDRNSSEPNGFKKHITEDHYMWNYLRFIIFLQEQDQDDDDGLELYVRKCVEDKKFHWFPMKRAMCMEKEDDDDAGHGQQIEVAKTESRGGGGGGGGNDGYDGEALSEMRALVEEMKKGMEEKMDKIEKDISRIGGAGNAGNIMQTSPSFRIGGNQRQQQQQQMRHTTSTSPMLEAQRIAARQQAQAQAEELPPLS